MLAKSTTAVPAFGELGIIINRQLCPTVQGTLHIVLKGTAAATYEEKIPILTQCSELET